MAETYIAIVDSATQVVVNIVAIAPDSVESYVAPEGCFSVAGLQGLRAAKGDAWDGEKFVKPARPDTALIQALRAALTNLKRARLRASRAAIYEEDGGVAANASLVDAQAAYDAAKAALPDYWQATLEGMD